MKNIFSQLSVLSRLPLLLLAFSLAFTGCDDDDDNGITITDDQTWDFADFQSNTTESRALATNLADMTTEMKRGRDAANTVAITDLTAYFTAGSPSLSEVSTTYYRDRVNTWFTRLTAASGNTHTPGDSASNGGVYGGYLFDAETRELEQFIEKGLFNAAMFNQALNVYLNGDVTAADVDQAFVCYGADVNFPNNGDDSFIAKYAARRDNGGFYSNLRVQFLTARIAAEEGNTEALNNSIEQIRTLWEAASAATVINYLYSTIDGLDDASASDDQKASAYHAWAEAIGFLYGFKSVAGTVVTDSQIDQWVAAMQYDNPYSLETSTSNLQGLQTVIDEIANLYGFSDPSIYQINDVSANGR